MKYKGQGCGKKEDGNQYFRVRSGADGWRNDRANRNIAVSDHCLLEIPEIRQWTNTSITSAMFRVIILSCGGHCCDGGMLESLEPLWVS